MSTPGIIRDRASVRNELRERIAKAEAAVENCGHPRCGKGFHPHGPRDAGEPKGYGDRPKGSILNGPKASRQEPEPDQGEASIALGPEFTAEGFRRRAEWEKAKCVGRCGEVKPRKDFYPSSGKVCRECFNARARDRSRAKAKAAVDSGQTPG